GANPPYRGRRAQYLDRIKRRLDRRVIRPTGKNNLSPGCPESVETASCNCKGGPGLRRQEPAFRQGCASTMWATVRLSSSLLSNSFRDLLISQTVPRKTPRNSRISIGA